MYLDLSKPRRAAPYSHKENDCNNYYSSNNKNDHLFLDWMERELDVDPSADGPARLMIQDANNTWPV